MKGLSVDYLVFAAQPIKHRAGLVGCVGDDFQTVGALFHECLAAELPDKSAVVDEAVMGRDFGKLLQNVAGNDDGDVLLAVDFLNDVAHFDDALRVQSVDRLVENEQIRFPYHGKRDAETLLHAERKMTDRLFAYVPQTDQRELLIDVVPRVHTAADGFELAVFKSVQVMVKTGLFDQAAHPFKGSAEFAAVRVESHDFHFAGGGTRKSRNHAEKGGLARAVASDESVNCAAFDLH